MKSKNRSGVYAWVLMLWVIGASDLPQDDDLLYAKVDHFQQQRGAFDTSALRDFDDITLSQMQFSGLECRILGTFYVHDGELWLGSDLESFAVATRLRVALFRSARRLSKHRRVASGSA